MIVDSYAKWRIKDVEMYYKATGGEEVVADDRLASRIADGLRSGAPEVVSGQRAKLMEDLTRDMTETAMEVLGVEVIDIRVKRIDLPEDVSESVFDRMAADREKEAREYRATGREQAEVIRADADRQSTVLLANAYRDAELLRGDGDARAAAIFADAFNQNPEFFAFVRSLEAYKRSFNAGNDLMVVDPSSEFFEYLKNAEGQK